MTFDEFKTAVQGWAEDRGIYEHSTPVAQALKAVREVGKVAEAVIKGQRDELIDGIGDVAVCLVNVTHMSGVALNAKEDPALEEYATKNVAAFLLASVVGLCATVSARKADTSTEDEGGKMEAKASSAMSLLIELARSADVSLEHCCEAAWGRMVSTSTQEP